MMKPITGRILALAALNGLIGTLMAALGAHTLDPEIGAERISWFETGALIQLAMTPGFLAAVILGEHGKKRWAHNSALSLMLGVLAFSGSLYLLALQGPGGLGAFHLITPFGGLFLLLGWGLIAIGALRSSKGFHG